MPAPGLTEQLGRFAAARLDPPAEALRIAKTGFIDTIATMIAGRDEPVVRAALAFVAARQSAAAEASVLLGHGRAATADAALINGAAGHALDYDDVALGGHPSTVLVPALLAEAELLDASGRDVLDAYLVGYEIWAELVARDTDPYHEKGWHPTAVLGTVAVAAAAAHLHRLPAAQCRNAIAMAASMTGGLVANFGSMTKPLHAGRAASNGLDAVHLTQLGLTAAPDAIEHAVGYLAALSPRGKAERERPADALGRSFRILDTGLSIKQYPMCYAVHRTIDGLLELATANDIDASRVRSVRATIGETAAAMLRNHSPATGLEAKFSLEFAAASALVARRVGLRELTDDFVRQEPVRAVMAKVRIDTVDTRCPVEPVFAYTDRVAVELDDGRTLDSGEIRFPRGNAKLPLSDAALEAKFMDCAGSDARLDSRRLYGMLAGLETLDHMRALRDCATAFTEPA
jgi:2-methylcitrate dehydratase PrpD